MGHKGQTKPQVGKVLHSLFGNLLSTPNKVPMMCKLASSRLKRMVVHYQADNHTLSYAILDTVREILFDNSTSAEWSQTPFATLKDRLKEEAPLAPLPLSAFPVPPTPPPAGIGTYLKATLPSEVFTLLQYVLHYGCRPDEADELFCLEGGTCERVLTEHLTALGAYERRGHEGSASCWPATSLRFVSKSKKPDCKCCRKSAVKVLQLASMLAPEQIEVVEAPKPPKKEISKPIKIRPLSQHKSTRSDSWFSGRAFLVAAFLSIILVSPLFFLNGRKTKVVKANVLIDKDKREKHVAHCPTTGKKMKVNEEVSASPARPFPIRCMGQIEVVLKPGSSARLVEGGIELLAGEMVVDIPEELDSPFKLCCGYFSSPLALGRFVANRDTERGKLSVFRGETKVRLAGVVTYNVETMRQATVDGEGHIKICDLVTALPKWLQSWYDSVRLTSKKTSSHYSKTPGRTWNSISTPGQRAFSKRFSGKGRRSEMRANRSSLKRVSRSSDFYRHLF